MILSGTARVEDTRQPGLLRHVDEVEPVGRGIRRYFGRSRPAADKENGERGETRDGHMPIGTLACNFLNSLLTFSHSACRLAVVAEQQCCLSGDSRRHHGVVEAIPPSGVQRWAVQAVPRAGWQAYAPATAVNHLLSEAGRG